VAGNRSTSEIKRGKMRSLIKSQKGMCPLCNKPLVLEKASLDHIVPKSFGGSGEMWNLRATHMTCNNLRGADCEDSAEYRNALRMHTFFGIEVGESKVL
jgi:5-methylcytosine-specific restriction endonuclease McrA